MSKPPLSPEEKDQLARELQQKLRRQRPRKALRLAIALVLLAIAVGVIWHFNRTPPESPPVLLACLDGVFGIGQPIRVEAWLQAAGEAGADVSGRDVTWERLGTVEKSASKTDSGGHATIELPPPEGEERPVRQRSVTSCPQQYRHLPG